MARGYRVTLDASLRVPWLMLLVTLGTIVATVWAFGIVKKGFLPVEDTSIIIVRTEAAPDIAFEAMLERQRIVAERIREDPDVLYVNSNVQQTFFNPTLNRGSIFVQLKSRSERKDRRPSATCRTGCGAPLPVSPASAPSRCRCRTCASAAAAAPPLYQYTLTSVDQAELYENAQRLIERVEGGAGLRRRDERPDARGAAAQARDRPRRTGALRAHRGRGALDALLGVRLAQDRHRLHALQRLRRHPGNR